MSSISIIAFIVLTLSVGYAFIYPSFNNINGLLDQKQNYLDSLDTVSNIENKKDELLTKLNEISEEDRKDIETILPSSFNFVKLISQIDSVASRYGISVDAVTSQEVGSAIGNSIENAEAPKTYSSAIVGFAFKSSYDQFNAFLLDLERSLRILDIKSVRLETSDTGVYSYRVEFETYWLK